MSTSEMGVADCTTLKLMQDEGKRLSFRKKRGEKRKIDRRLYLIQ